MNLLQCYEQLHNFVHEHEEDHRYSAEEIDIDQIWNVLLSSAEVSLNSLSGFAALLEVYTAEYQSDSKCPPSIAKAVEKYADPKISAKERFKSLAGMLAFMPFFPHNMIMKVVHASISILKQLTKQSETIPFKSLAKYSIYAQLPIDVLNEVFEMVKKAPMEDYAAIALLMGFFYIHYMEICDDETQPTIDEYLFFIDELIYKGLKYGDDITKACVAFLAEYSALTDNDSYTLMDECFQPGYTLATNKDPILAKMGHRLIIQLFNQRSCRDVDHVYQFLNVKEQYKNIHHFYKELRFLCLSTMDEIDEENVDYGLSEIVQKKIIKFLNRIISNEKCSDMERSEALGTIAEIADSGVELNKLFSDEQLKVAVELLSRPFDAKNPINYPTIAHFLTVPSVIASEHTRGTVKQYLPLLFELVKKPIKPSYIGYVGIYLSEIVCLDDFADFREKTVELIHTLLKSTCLRNIENAADMILKVKPIINEHSAGKLYQSAIEAIESCEDIDTVSDLFKAVKKLIRYFPVDEELSQKFVLKIINGQIASLSNIPLMYFSEDSLCMFKFIGAYIDRFGSRAKELNQIFVDILKNAYDEMKFSVLIPICSILKQNACNEKQCNDIKQVCYSCFEKLGYTYSDTLSKAALAVSYIREHYPKLINSERIVPLMQEVLDNYMDDSDDDSSDDEDSDMKNFTGITPFLKICLDIINANPDECTEVESVLSTLLQKISDDENKLLDEICNSMSTYLENNKDSPLGSMIGKFLITIPMKPDVAEGLGISEKTIKTAQKCLKQYYKSNPDFESEIMAQLGHTHDIKRRIKAILGTLFH